MPFPIVPTQPPFADFVFSNNANRRYCIIAAAAIIGQLTLFKIFYPFASFFYTDSFGYLYAAASNQDANVWPVGYSKFLRVFNTFIHSDTGLVIFQYLFLQTAGLYWWFTIRQLFRPSKIISNALYIFLLFQPVSLYIANSVSSDALFIGLSLIWITRLLIMMRYPTRKSILTHALLLAAIFTIRYNAIYYPLAAAIAIGLSRYSIKEKVLAITLPIALIGAFILHTGRATEEMTGTRQFSPFSGWQLANNALYMYGHVLPHPSSPPTAKSIDRPPVRFAGLDSAVRYYFDREHQSRTLFDSIYPGIYFLWSPQSPLMRYVGQQRQKDTGAAWFKTWASVGPLYSSYAAWLIKTYPAAFIRYYLSQNIVRYALPPAEFMDRYNSGADTVEAVAKYWFQYKDNRVHSFSARFQHHLLTVYPFLNLLINAFFLGILGIFCSTRGARRADPFFYKYLVSIAGLWLLNFLFSVFAAPIVLRYQVFLMIVGLTFSLLLVQHLMKWEADTKACKNRSDETSQQDRGGLRVLPDPSMGLHGNS